MFMPMSTMGVPNAYLPDLVKQIRTQNKPDGAPSGAPTGLSGKNVFPRGPIGSQIMPPTVVPPGLTKPPQGLTPTNTGGPTTKYSTLNDLADLLGINKGSLFSSGMLNNVDTNFGR